MNKENMTTPPAELPKHLATAEKFAVDIMYNFDYQQIDEILNHIKHIVNNRKDSEFITMQIKIAEMQKKINRLEKTLESL